DRRDFAPAHQAERAAAKICVERLRRVIINARPVAGNVGQSAGAAELEFPHIQRAMTTENEFVAAVQRKHSPAEIVLEARGRRSTIGAGDGKVVGATAGEV